MSQAGDNRAVQGFTGLPREVRVYTYDMFMEFFHLIFLECFGAWFMTTGLWGGGTTGKRGQRNRV